MHSLRIEAARWATCQTPGGGNRNLREGITDGKRKDSEKVTAARRVRVRERGPYSDSPSFIGGKKDHIWERVKTERGATETKKTYCRLLNLKMETEKEESPTVAGKRKGRGDGCHLCRSKVREEVEDIPPTKESPCAEHERAQKKSGTENSIPSTNGEQRDRNSKTPSTAKTPQIGGAR